MAVYTGGCTAAFFSAPECVGPCAVMHIIGYAIPIWHPHTNCGRSERGVVCGEPFPFFTSKNPLVLLGVRAKVMECSWRVSLGNAISQFIVP